MTLEELKKTLNEASQVFILTDENVAMFWLPETAHWLGCERAIEIVLKPGEKYKTMQTAQRIWKTLMKHHADRQTVVVNLGGGVITDLGGFVASCYQRGIRFVNVPTTLLAMVDAAIGGKTGVDFGGCKNQIGTFAEPLEVWISPIYLSTLPQREILSGVAEMMKYGFIVHPTMLKVNSDNYQEYLLAAGKLKREIVAKDYKEQGLRKVLNFGHTLGHAIESHCFTKDEPLLHGEAVALGMGAALWLSVQLCHLDEKVLRDYERQLPTLLSEAETSLDAADVEPVMQYLAHDKKNKDGKEQFVLIEAPGQPVLDVEVAPEKIREALAYILNKVYNQ
jgi:3-dehydroquinate synthase